MNREEIINFLREVHVGDKVALQLKPTSSRRRYLPSIEGNIVSLSYYYVYLSDRMPDKVVPDQERMIRLLNVLEYTVL